MRNKGDLCWCVEISSFCVVNAINSIDKHSLREVELLNLHRHEEFEEKVSKYIVQV